MGSLRPLDNSDLVLSDVIRPPDGGAEEARATAVIGGGGLKDDASITGAYAQLVSE